MKKYVISLITIVLAMFCTPQFIFSQVKEGNLEKVTHSDEALRVYNNNYKNLSKELLKTFENKLISNRKKQDSLRIIIEMNKKLAPDPKGEFEKIESYFRRLKEYKNSLVSLSQATTNLNTLQNNEKYLINKISNEKEYILDLLPPMRSIENLSSISEYHSEDEYFIVEFNGSKHYVQIPILDAPEFKMKYHDIVILEFPCSSLKFVFKQQVYDLDNLIIDSRNGNAYKIVRIGRQTWMAENLNYATSSGSRLYYGDKSGDIYGRMYKWEAAMKACPSGWHLPNNEEWIILRSYFGGKKKAGTKLKEQGFWKLDITHNESGFSARPSGYLSLSFSSRRRGTEANFWSATSYKGKANLWQLLSKKTDFFNFSENTSYSFSVRCIKD